MVWLEQEDARLISQGEEVTLMDWGNAIVEVRLRIAVLLQSLCACSRVCCTIRSALRLAKAYLNFSTSSVRCCYY